MKKLRVVQGKSNRKTLVRITRQQAENGDFHLSDGSRINSEHMLISLLLPAAVREFYRNLEAEVSTVCGARYDRAGDAVRWGEQNGSIYLGGQKVAVRRQRVRDAAQGREIALETYDKFQDPRLFEQQVFREGLRHVSQRDYARGLPQIGGAFGFGKTTVSKHWCRATEKQLQALNNRSLKEMDIVAVFIDGKRFGSLGVVVALGVASNGRKFVLGIYQANTENAAACRARRREVYGSNI